MEVSIINVYGGRLSLTTHSNEHVQSNHQWVLCAMESPRLRAGRGLSFGHLYRGDTGEVGTCYLGGVLGSSWGSRSYSPFCDANLHHLRLKYRPRSLDDRRA